MSVNSSVNMSQLKDLDTPDKYYNYFAIFAVIGALVLVNEAFKSKKNGISLFKKANNKSGKKQVGRGTNKDRKYGTWVPENFQTPTPSPYPNWDFEKTRPLPYRAFKHKYNITMGIRNMDWNQWIELDNEWLKFHEAKLRRLSLYDRKLYETTPEAVDATYELLEELRQYLPQRYPSLFRQTQYGMENLKTKEDHKFLSPFNKYTGPDCGHEDPILMAAKCLQDDVAVMMESPDGEYILKGGAIILPGFWKFRDKFNLTLEKIHTTGDVPKFKEKLQNGMEKFFVRLSCDKPVVRNNYFLQTDEELGWSSSIGDEFGEKVGWYTAKEASDVSKIHLRSERQSLRRLPRLGAIIFTVRTYFVPIEELAKEPYIPRRLLNGILSWEPDVQDYRGYTKFKDVLLPYLEKKAEEQDAMGYIQEKGPDVFPF